MLRKETLWQIASGDQGRDYSWLFLKHDLMFLGPGRFGPYEEQKYREAFLVDKDPEAMRWLMANRLHSGMTVAQVGLAFGEDGEREYNDRWIKTKGGQYRTGDKAYRWGPDNLGNSMYLVFRENQLVNYDPREYEEPSYGSGY